MVSFRIVLVSLASLVACGRGQSEGSTNTTGDGKQENETTQVTTELVSTQDITDSETTSTTKSTTIDPSHDKILTEINEITSTVTTVHEETTNVTPKEDENKTNVTRDFCDVEQCRNGGTCENDPENDSFRCLCPERYAGLRCEVRDLCEIGPGGELCESGACAFSQDGSLRQCICFQDQSWDEKKKLCRAEEPPCFPNPCKNGGSCSVESGSPRCSCAAGFEGEDCSVLDKCGSCEGGQCLLNKTTSTKSCRCREGQYWDEAKQGCRDDVPPCLPQPCRNDGTCTPLSDDAYNCSCAEGFSGPTCEAVDRCSGHEDCGGGGNCVLSEDGTERACRCGKGYYLEEFSRTCEEVVKPCRPNPCLHDGICTADSDLAFHCTCSAGYEGPTCAVRDPCQMDGAQVFCAGANCTADDRELGTFLCLCEEGQYFDYSQRKCKDLDMCALMRCGDAETCSAGECICKESWIRDNSTASCKPDACSRNPCPATGMVCEEGSDINDYRCHCPEGRTFNGVLCIDKPSCDFPSLNHCTQLCTESGDGGFQCGCEEGFQLQEDNRTCLHVSNNTCASRTCVQGSCAVDSGGEEICICPSGSVEVDGRCMDTCSANQVSRGLCPDDQCESVVGLGFRCKCEGKYALATDGATCSVREVCKRNEVGWKYCSSQNGRCVPDWEQASGFKCACPENLVQTDDGKCVDKCSSDENQVGCAGMGAMCDVDTSGKVYCKCLPYFQKNVYGFCSKAANASLLVTLPLDPSTYKKDENRKQRSLDQSLDYRKIRRDVALAAKGLYFDFTEASVLSCKPDTEILLCRVELQFRRQVSESELRRLHSERLCIGQRGSSKCLLPPTLVLVRDKIGESVTYRQTDPCDSDIRDDVCGSETTCSSSAGSKGFNCTCGLGFEARRKEYPFGDPSSFVEICRDIDECLESDRCPQHSDCTNTIGSYSCSCQKGFRNDAEGQRCTAICDPNPCVHGACSSRGNHDFDCACEAGFKGSLCDLEDKNFKGARINTIVVGVVLGGALLITLILSFACYSRLKRKKEIDDSSVYYNSAEMTERRNVSGGTVNNAFQRE